MWSTEFLVMAGSLLVLLFFNLYMFARVAFPGKAIDPDRDTPVSVVICARNEAHRLEKMVPLLMQQEHNDFEVVVVNEKFGIRLTDVISPSERIKKLR